MLSLQCDPEATTPLIDEVSEENCVYYMVMYTAAVCVTPAPVFCADYYNSAYLYGVFTQWLNPDFELETRIESEEAMARLVPDGNTGYIRLPEPGALGLVVGVSYDVYVLTADPADSNADDVSWGPIATGVLRNGILDFQVTNLGNALGWSVSDRLLSPAPCELCEHYYSGATLHGLFASWTDPVSGALMQASDSEGGVATAEHKIIPQDDGTLVLALNGGVGLYQVAVYYHGHRTVIAVSTDGLKGLALTASGGRLQWTLDKFTLTPPVCGAPKKSIAAGGDSLVNRMQFCINSLTQPSMAAVAPLACADFTSVDLQTLSSPVLTE